MIDKQIVVVLHEVRYALLEDVVEIAWDDKESDGAAHYGWSENVYFHLRNGRMLRFYKEDLAPETLKDINDYVARFETGSVTS